MQALPALSGGMQRSDTPPSLGSSHEDARVVALPVPRALPGTADSKDKGALHHSLSMGAPVALDGASQMQIVYTDLRYSVAVKEKGSRVTSQRHIIRGVNGVIQPGKLTAVMGASGAGKTTMLNVLAGNMRGTADVSGVIKVNGEVMEKDRMRQISGFVHQEDVIMDTMTVREALLFAAQLKLPPTMPSEEKVRRALDIAHLLNLRKSLDSVVGSALIKGISGGEKRRLSLGMEMITNPSILFLDEPTSGLDSFTAYKVARIMQTVASKYNRTIVCTIHQPSSEVFAIFHDLIVLAEGQVMYHGEIKAMVPYFASQGYPCPMHFNPADFLFMDVLHSGGGGGADSKYDFLSGENEDEETRTRAREEEAARIRGLILSWEESAPHKEMMGAIHRSNMMNHGISDSALQQTAPFGTQFRLLGARSANNAWRNQLILKGKFAQTIFLSIVAGLIFLRVSPDAKGIQDRQGSLFFLVVQGLFGSVMGVLTVFGGEKSVFVREQGSRMYGLPAYFLSRWLVDLPSHIVMPLLSSVILYFLIGYQQMVDKFFWFALIIVLMENCGAALGIFVSCLFNDLSVAMTVMPMFLLPLMVFSGFFVNNDNLGWWFKWISYLSPMKYGFIALAKNEFEGLRIECDSTVETCEADGKKGGERVIELLGFANEGTVGENAGILLALMGGFLALAYIALWMSVRRMHV